MKDKRKDKDGTLICRFRFPFHYHHGYELPFDALGYNLEQVIRTTLPPGGASFTDGKLNFARNHPTILHHVPQLLVIWGANIEGRRVVQSSGHATRNDIVNDIVNDIFDDSSSTMNFNVAKTASSARIVT